jgi:hypothetical protein
MSIVSLSFGRRSSGAMCSTWSDLAIVTPGADIRSIREALRLQEKGEASAQVRTLLETLGFETAQAMPIETLLEGRRQRLLAEERRFVSDLGLQWEDGET